MHKKKYVSCGGWGGGCWCLTQMLLLIERCVLKTIHKKSHIQTEKKAYQWEWLQYHDIDLWMLCDIPVLDRLRLPRVFFLQPCIMSFLTREPNNKEARQILFRNINIKNYCETDFLNCNFANFTIIQWTLTGYMVF